MKKTNCHYNNVIFTAIIFFACLSTVNAQVKNFVSPSRNIGAVNQNAIGFGYYNEPILYKFKDGSQEDYISNYSGWLVKVAHYIDQTTALNAYYIQARGKEELRVFSGSALYGFNLNRPGIGAYIGISYSLKQRTQFAGERRLSNEKDHDWDIPIGIQAQNSLFTLSFETRYKHFLLEGDNVEAEGLRYPLYFSLLVNF